MPENSGLADGMFLWPSIPDTIMFVDMDVVGVMAAYLPVMRVHVNGHDRTITVILAKHCIKLHDDGSRVIRNMLEQF